MPTLVLVAESGMIQNHLFSRRTMMVSVLASPASRSHVFKVAEHGELLPFGMHLAQIFLVAGQVAAAGGINQIRGAKLMGFPRRIARLDIDAVGLGRKAADGPAFAHVGARGARVFEQEMIKQGALDLNGFGRAVESALAKNKASGDGAVAQLELRGIFVRETSPPAKRASRPSPRKWACCTAAKIRRCGSAGKTSFSRTSTRLPARARKVAALLPPGPQPITKASYIMAVTGRIIREIGGHGKQRSHHFRDANSELRARTCVKPSCVEFGPAPSGNLHK